MKRTDLLTLYGRLGFIIAAFALIAVIVASPLMSRAGSPVAFVAWR